MIRMMMSGLALIAALGSGLAAELGTLAGPAEMTVTLYPGQSRAQVEEVRTVRVPAGESLLALTWAGAKVDPASPALEVEGAEVLEALRPLGLERGMQWRVKSAQARVAQSRVTYAVEGLKWQPAYELHLGGEAGAATLLGQVAVTNESGLRLSQARVRVAIEGLGLVDRLGGAAAGETAPQPALLAQVAHPCSLAPGASALWEFLRLNSLQVENLYRYEPERSATNIMRTLQLSLPAGQGPGLQGLPPGSLALYEGGDVPALLTQLAPQAGKPLEIALGTEPDLIIERTLISSLRSNFETDRTGRVSGLDTTETYELCLRNRTAAEVVVLATETVLSTWELSGPRPPEEQTATSATFRLAVRAGEEISLRFTLIKHAGTRVKK
jgi:hypothetical protein